MTCSLRATWYASVAVARAAQAVDWAICLLPPTRRVRALVLDSLLGPTEEFEIVSTTAPKV